MPTYSETLDIIRRSDNGVFITVLFTVFVVVAGLHVSRRIPMFARVGAAFAAAFVPLTTLVINPAGGLLASLTTITIPRLKLRSIPYPLAAIMVVALLIRLPMLFDSFWYDEAFTARIISLPLSALPNAILADVHPPAFYVFLWFWRLISSAEWWLRLPVLLSGLLAIWLLYRLTIRITADQTVALIAAALAALLPAQSYYATELRSYSLIACMVMVAALALIDARRNVFVILLALLPWTHNVGFFYVAVLALFGFIKRPQWFGWIMLALVVASVWLTGAYIQSQWMTDPDGHWTWFVAGTAFQPIFNMTLGVNGAGSNPILMIAAFALTTAAVPLLWRSQAARFANRRWLWLALVFGVPAIIAVLSVVWRPIYVWRHMFPSAFMLLIAWAYLIRYSLLARRVFAPVLLLAMLGFYTSGYAVMRQPYEAWIARYCAGADSLYATSINAAFTLSANSATHLLVWSGALDNGRTVNNDMLPLYGFQRGDLSELRGRVCVVWFERPEAWESERTYIADITRGADIHDETITGWNKVRFAILGGE